MRKLIAIILILIGFSAIAQTPPRTGYLVQPAKWKFVNPVWLDSGAYITKIVKTSGQNRYLVYDSLTGKIGYRYVSVDFSNYVPYTGATTNVNIGANTYIGHSLKSDASDGVLIEAANGTDVGIFGAGNTANSSLYGGLTVGSLTSGNGTDSVVVASSAGLLKKRPASAFGSTYTGGNGIIVSGSTIYRDSLKTTGQYGNTWGNGMYLGSSNNRSLVWRTNALQRMTLDSNGRLGLGIRNPTYALELVGYTNGIRVSCPSASGYHININNTTYGSTDAKAFGFYQNNSGYGVVFNNNISSFVVTPTGNTTMGAAADISKLAIPSITASANYGTFSLSNTTTAFDGSTTGKFVGSANGQYIAINSVGSVAYNFLDFQKNGVSRFKVDSIGNLTANGFVQTQTIRQFTSASAISVIGGFSIQPTVNMDAVTATGLSLTGSQSVGVLNLLQTWNTSGNPTAIKLNVTNTASGATSKLLDLQVGSVSQFNVDKSGGTTANKYYVSALNTAPSSASDTGTAGEIRFTNGYIYLCVAANTWIRTAMATW